VYDSDDMANADERPTGAVGPDFLGRLLDRHAAALALYARQWCRTPDDVVQQAFVQLARQNAIPQQIETWLYRVVRNGAISAGRAEQRRRQHETAVAEMAGAWFVPTEPPGLDAATAASALEGLAVDEREVIVAHLWGGLTFQEIAAVTGLSPSTAHRRYESGLRQLRETMTRSEQRRM
jgi:DNA-directed RNA polymerase specialized sigma24 family protein